MNTVQLSLILLLIPIFYSISKIWKRKDLNMLDFLLMFTCLHFSVSPLLYIDAWYYDAYITRVFIIIAIFEYGILILSLLWDRYFNSRDSIVNVTQFLRRIKYINISNIGYVLLFVLIMAVMVVYMPYAIITTRIDDASEILKNDYVLKSTLAVLASALSFVIIIMSLKIVLQIKKGNYIFKDVLFIILCFIICAFFPRRIFVQNILFFIIIFYSVCREKINLRFIVITLLSAMFVFNIYFPFYNIIRNNPIRLDSNAPIQSLYEITQYGFEHEEDFDKAEKTTKQRTTGLFEALYLLQASGTTLMGGELLMSEIDVAIPKILNPSKGNGSEAKLEKMTGCNHDIADSFLLEACGDFGILGAIIAILLYVVLFYIYDKYSFFLLNTTEQNIIPFFILYSLFSLCWDVERSFGSGLSWFVGSFPWIVFVFLCSYFKIIYIGMKKWLNLSKLKKLKMIKES